MNNAIKLIPLRMIDWKHCRLALSFVLMSIGITACGTPVEVKDLSSMQTRNLSVAATAVTAQGEALLLLAKQILDKNAKQIEDEHNKTVMESRKYAADGFPDDGDKDEAAKIILESVLDSERTRSKSIAELEKDLHVIESKSKELSEYIVKLKEAQTALDGFLQSEQLGDRLLSRLFDVPGVNQAINSITTLTNKVASSTNLLNAHVRDLTRNRKEPQ